MKFAYADPPYLGCGKRLYSKHHPEAAVWDDPSEHVALAQGMDAAYDGWALSLHEPSLRVLLPLMPDGVRVGAWVKPFCSFKPNVNPAYAWEPVIYRAVKRDRSVATVRDWVSANITLKRGMTGATPAAFCAWLFELLGASPRDEFHDLFPGSGAVTEAWSAYCGQQAIQGGLFSQVTCNDGGR